jgi:hypothetical protein
LHNAQHVFLVGASSDTVVALSADFDTHPEKNFTTTRFDIPGSDIASFLQQNNITYQLIPPDFPHEVRSPNGRWIARDDGIYLADTDQLIVKAPRALVRGWTNHGKAAIYSSNGRCLLSRGLPFSDDNGCAISVPQPVLTLGVPEKYWLPAESP